MNEECLICKSALEYLGTDEEMECVPFTKAMLRKLDDRN